MYNILNSISSVNLYTERCNYGYPPSCCCGFFKSGIQMCITAIIIISFFYGAVSLLNQQRFTTTNDKEKLSNTKIKRLKKHNTHL